VVLALATAGLVGCSSSGPSTGSTGTTAVENVPAGPGGSAPESVAFDGLPMAPASQVVGARTDTGVVVTQSFVTTELDAHQVLTFYAEQLPTRGWSPQQEPAEGDAGVWRGTWTKDGFSLEVTAEPRSGGAAGGIPGATAQYDLMVRA
jgi:hypothetical protein